MADKSKQLPQPLPAPETLPALVVDRKIAAPQKLLDEIKFDIIAKTPEHGRKPALTIPKVKRLYRLFAKGHGKVESANLVGIAYDTLRQWLIECPPLSALIALAETEFLESLRGKAQSNVAGHILEGKDFGKSMTVLERIDNRWAPKHSGGPQTNVQINLSA